MDIEMDDDVDMSCDEKRRVVLAFEEANRFREKPAANSGRSRSSMDVQRDPAGRFLTPKHAPKIVMVMVVVGSNCNRNPFIAAVLPPDTSQVAGTL